MGPRAGMKDAHNALLRPRQPGVLARRRLGSTSAGARRWKARCVLANFAGQRADVPLPRPMRSLLDGRRWTSSPSRPATCRSCSPRSRKRRSERREAAPATRSCRCAGTGDRPGHGPRGRGRGDGRRRARLAGREREPLRPRLRAARLHDRPARRTGAEDRRAARRRAWKQGEWSGDYKQQIPTEGAPPSQPTEIKILYDEKNIYVAIRAHDDPTLMHRWPGRRDEDRRRRRRHLLRQRQTTSARGSSSISRPAAARST